MIIPCPKLVTTTTVFTWTFVARRVPCVRAADLAALAGVGRPM